MEDPVAIEYLADYPELIPVLATWVYDYWGEMYKIKSLEESIEKISERLNIDKLPLAFVALAGSKPVGTASLKIQEMTTHKHLYHWLGAFYVAAEYRNKGIGAALVNRAETKAHELGVETLYLHTPDKELFYRNLGWETIERPIYFDMPVTIMRKELL
jgi:GNAT superfamily N-acetyltransferase